MSETANFQIIELPAQRWQELRDLRLEALQLHPQTFVSVHEEEVEFDCSKWQSFLIEEQYKYLFVEDNQQNLVGMGALVFHPGKKYAHLAELGSVFIKAEFRRRKAFSQLLHSLEKVGKERGLEKLFTYSSHSNVGSLSAYVTNGFKVVGNLTNQMKNDGVYFDEYILEKFI